MSSIVLVVFIVLVVLVFLRDIACVDGVELFDNLPLLARLARFLVFDLFAHALHQHHVLFGERARHLAGLAFIDTGNNRNRVAFFNMESIHTISITRPPARARLWFGSPTPGARAGWGRRCGRPSALFCPCRRSPKSPPHFHQSEYKSRPCGGRVCAGAPLPPSGCLSF